MDLKTGMWLSRLRGYVKGALSATESGVEAAEQCLAAAEGEYGKAYHQGSLDGYKSAVRAVRLIQKEIERAIEELENV